MDERLTLQLLGWSLGSLVMSLFALYAFALPH
jgi:hypothetical protein